MAVLSVFPVVPLAECWRSDLLQLDCLNERIVLLKQLSSLRFIIVYTIMGFSITMRRAEITAASIEIKENNRMFAC